MVKRRPVESEPPVGAWVGKFLSLHPEWVDDIDLVAAPPSDQEALQEYPELAGSDALKWVATSYGMPRISLYCHLRRKGQSHRFAEMVSCQRGPALMTDVTFFQGLPKLHDQFVDSKQREKVIAVAKRHGYTPGIHDVYEPGLARFQGDPEAFVPPTGGRSYIKKLCERRGWACNGAVNVPHRQPLRDPLEDSVPLAEDIIQRNMREYVARDPSLAKMSRQALREKIVAKHGVKSDGTLQPHQAPPGVHAG